MKDKDLLNLLKKNGWEVKRIHGSHHIYNTLCRPVCQPLLLTNCAQLCVLHFVHFVSLTKCTKCV